MKFTKNTWVVLTAVATLLNCFAFTVIPSYAQTGNFAVVLNEQTGFGDSRRSATFYDADDLASGPMFSVFIGYDVANNYEDPGTIDVDPVTGDVYLGAYDSGTPAGDPDGDPLGLDSIGDYDIYKINFATVFNHWDANFKGTDARTLGGALALGGLVPGGTNNSLNLDYITYGPANPFLPLFPFDASHSNTFELPGSVEKIAEVKRNNGGNFFPFSLEFIDEDTLFFLDDSSTTTATDTATTDHEYRIIERVSTSPGAADDAVGDFLDGGFNRGASESWNSRRIGLVHRDAPGGVPTGHSEPESTAFYADPVSGVRGVWVTESDGGGDDISFLEIDGSGNSLGYRPHSTTGNPDAFALDNDPFVNATTNDGKADNIFVDADTGDLIIIESGFGDQADGITVDPDHEPAVIRREVISYDNGAGQIQFGAWSEKVFLNPTKTPGDALIERGQWTAYDSANDLVYFFAPGGGGAEVPLFEYDMWILDLATGVTSSFLDLDESVSLFGGDAFGDKVDFFSLGNNFDPADLNMDGFVDGLDLGILLGNWNLAVNPDMGELNGIPPVDGLDLGILLGSWNPPPLASAVPEPTSVAIFGLALGMMTMFTGRRRMS